jgi:hypothetical protein
MAATTAATAHGGTTATATATAATATATTLREARGSGRQRQNQRQSRYGTQSFQISHRIHSIVGKAT